MLRFLTFLVCFFSVFPSFSAVRFLKLPIKNHRVIKNFSPQVESPFLGIQFVGSRSVYPVRWGRVIRVGELEGYPGLSVIIRHDEKDGYFFSIYSGFKSTSVSIGEGVTTQNRLGAVGRKKGLYFEVRNSDALVIDPMVVLDFPFEVKRISKSERLMAVRGAYRYLQQVRGMSQSEASQFLQAVKRSSGKIGVPVTELLSVMMAESNLNHLAKSGNAPLDSGQIAVGLIQWRTTTARALGTTQRNLYSLSSIGQLKYVERYFFQAGIRENIKKYNSLSDTHMAVFQPHVGGELGAGIKAPGDMVVISGRGQAYRQNRGLDKNGDGQITKTELSRLTYRAFFALVQRGKN